MSRRHFVPSGDLVRQSRDSIADVWGPRQGFVGEGQWPARVDEALTEEPDRWVQSACVLCSNGCGLDIGVKDGRIVGVRGRAEDRSNRGRLGPKGLHGWQANNSPDRLTRPLIRRGGQLVEASWDEAMDLIVAKSRKLVERYTASSIGFYTTGRLMLEEYYTLGVIGKAGLGTPHMDGNTRLCTSTAAAALKETFGWDGQPGTYSDLDVTDCILHAGHNIAETDTVLHMRILDRLAGPRPPKVICIDPRETATVKHGALQLAPRPLRRGAHRGLRGPEADVRDLHARRGGAPRRGPRRQAARGGPHPGRGADAGLDGAARRLPVQPGDGSRLPG